MHFPVIHCNPAATSPSTRRRDPPAVPATYTARPSTPPVPANMRVIDEANRTERVKSLAAVVRLETPWVARLLNCITPCCRGVRLHGLCEGLVLTGEGIKVAPDRDADRGPAPYEAASREAFGLALDHEISRLDPRLLVLENFTRPGAQNPRAPGARALRALDALGAWALRQEAEEG